MEPNSYYPQQQTYPLDTGQAALRKKLVIGGAILAILGLLLWLFTHAYIEVTVAEADGNGEYTYVLAGPDGEGSTTKSSENTFRKLVSKGRYQVSVTQGESSYFASTQTGSFMGTTEVQANLQNEAERRFVGNEPGACMLMVGSRLVSGPCGAGLSEYVVHQPASPSLPTVVERFPPNAYDYAGSDLVTTSEGIIGLNKVDRPDAGTTSYYLYKVQPDLSITDDAEAAFLDENQSYTLKAYGDGFVIYNADLSSVFQLASLKTQPKQLRFNKPADESLNNLALIDVQKDAIIAEYTNQSPAAGGDAESALEDSSKAKTEFIVYTQSGQNHFKFNKLFTSAQACGDQKLCLITKTDLEVYDISSDEANLIYRVPKVTSTLSVGNRLIAYEDNRILSLDVDAADGFVEYTFGKYSFCGWQATDASYLLCILNPDGDRSALAITPGTKNSLSIDKQVLMFYGVDEIKKVSVYDNFVYLSPNYGKMGYQPSLGRVGYNPELKAATNQRITELINESGINKPPYIVTNGGL